MHISVETITPKAAAAMLEMNTKNRPLSKSRVNLIKTAIERGEWRANGDAIRISETNVLLDGQTRLSAIVAAGIPVESVVIRGLPDEVFSTIDINGSKRTASDVLAIKGVKNYIICASIAAAAIIWERTKNSSHTISSTSRPTTTEIETRASTDIAIQDAANFVSSSDFIRKMMTKKIAGYVRYLTYKDDPEKSDAFFNGLISGVGLSEGSPVLLLREVLIKNAANFRSASYDVMVAWCIYAYISFKEGRSMKFLRITTDGNAKNVHLYQGI